MKDVQDEILARITPSAARRAFATGVLAALGTLLVLLAFLRPPDSVPLQLFVAVLGMAVLVLCVRLYRATGQGLLLTAAGIRDTAGREVVRLADILKVERGIFAFKPSNGFLLHLSAPQPRVWAPGLWWRSGRRVGIGGVISGAEGRYMADRIDALLVQGSGGQTSA
ncbi:hypothetical protein R5H32_13260 [Defluviimonas sp. D31]|jgi:hypothetical protein|uniref:hypothetical protein n=1 Tax=Defluviimonas sp. D31 TaxID=3083253 RepID=UPI00296F13C5|nr:hypothetical protein [Defluviimonas sp. D31]MDW4550324.1 hypothetical protein [Defluviimonas sp. D31]